MSFTRALSTNNYGCAKYIVDGSIPANATHSTIQAAINSASAGDTIFIRPKTSGTAYSENLTLKAGVNLCAFGCDSSLDATGHVIISGKCTFTGAGSVTIYGIQLQTNSDFLLAVTGSVASIVNLNNCYLNCTNNTGISYTSSSASSQVNLYYCQGDIGTTGIGLYTCSSAGKVNIEYTEFTNSGNSTTTSTTSATSVQIRQSTMPIALETSSTGNVNVRFTNMTLQSLNTTVITTAGTGTNTLQHCKFFSGTASAISIGVNTTVQVEWCSIESSNTNSITGAGSLINTGITITNTGTSGVNPTTYDSRPMFTGSLNLKNKTEINTGSGSPNGSVTALKGSLYLRTDGSGTTNRAYINTDGGTTWTAITTVA